LTFGQVNKKFELMLSSRTRKSL